VLDTLTDLGADATPILNAVKIKPQALLLTACDRVEETDAFDPPPIALIPAVRHHNVVKRLFLGATARQSNLYHSENLQFLAMRPGRREPAKGTAPGGLFAAYDSATVLRKPVIHGQSQDSGNRVF
jgi:hypothetical protein